MVKTKYVPLIAVISAICLSCGCSQTTSPAGDALGQTASSMAQTAETTEDTGAVELVSNIATTQYFTDEPVSAAI